MAARGFDASAEETFAVGLGGPAPAVVLLTCPEEKKPCSD